MFEKEKILRLFEMLCILHECSLCCKIKLLVAKAMFH